MSASHQTSTVTWTLPQSTPLYSWSTQTPAALQTSGQSNGGHCGLTTSSLTAGASKTDDRMLSCTAVAGRSVMMSGRCPSDTGTVSVLSTRGPGPLSSVAGTSHPSSVAHGVTLQPAERADAVSSGGDVSQQLTSAALELGNVHLRDLLSQDDDERDGGGSRASPQEPQSTSCDDAPDSSTGNVHSNDTPILKQLLSDGDAGEHNEVSACEPETTHRDKQSHVLLKVCSQQC